MAPSVEGRHNETIGVGRVKYKGKHAQGQARLAGVAIDQSTRGPR